MARRSVDPLGTEPMDITIPEQPARLSSELRRPRYVKPSGYAKCPVCKTLKAIGMLSPQRTQAAPEIPTFAEQGLPGFSVEAWFAVIGPKGLPPAQVQQAHKALVAAFADPAVKDAMARQGNVIQVQPAEQAAPFFRSEMAKYAKLVKQAGIELQ